MKTHRIAANSNPRIACLFVLTPALLAACAVHAQSPTADSFNPGADNNVYALAVQADGKVLVGGSFTFLGDATRNRIGRLNADGTLDNEFDPGASDGIYSLAVQPDAKILVGGSFTTLGGQERNRIGRLNVDGTVDSGFNPGAGSDVTSLAVQADGTILVGGWFTTLGGQTRNYIGRLHANGAPDNTFNPGANRAVNCIAVQADGKILVGGEFTTLGGQTRNYIGRLNSDGTLDSAFNPGASSTVNCIAVQADGKILVGGRFTTLGGQTRNYLGRLNADGTLDSSFNPGANYNVNSVVIQADGKILVGGGFSMLGGQARSSIGRLNADGTLDGAFNAGADSDVSSLAIQPDGKILVGGGFYTLGGQWRNRIGRLNNSEPATQNLSHSGSTITWLRGGSGPEVWHTTFEHSTNGSAWSSLGAGGRVVGGWQLTNAAFPATATLRARGVVTGGRNNASSWFVEAYFGSPVIVSQPIHRTNDAGTTANFSVAAAGSEPLGFRWLRNGVAMTDGGGISGATLPTLTLSNVLGGDAAAYCVTVSNSQGSVTSQVATLTVRDPIINGQPVSAARELGQSATLSVTAVGTAPLTYRWLKEGMPVSGATSATLSLTNLQGTDAGAYCVVVSNVFGCRTSTVALLTVNEATMDAGFNPGLSWAGVYALAAQDDGKILVATSGGLGTTPQYLLRVNADGTADTGFNPGATNGSVETIALQADGKILVGGSFTILAGQTRNRIARLNADGSLDSIFNPGASGGYGTVDSLVVQPDGKIVVGGSFRTLGGQTRDKIGRLNADGTLDSTFNPGANDTVEVLVVQPDGKILVGGSFTTLGGQTRNRIGRLNANGTLDTSFNPGANKQVFTIAVQADGKILVGGSFTTLGGQARTGIGRLNADGTVDNDFNPGTVGPGGLVDGNVYSQAVQTDGKILVGGWFSTLGGQPRERIGRLNADGTVDLILNPGMEGSDLLVESLAVQADGRILVGGRFTTLGGQYVSNLGRLINTGPATQDLNCSGSVITWLRGGTSPEVWRTAFEVSTNGTDWIPLGSGLRIAGGWQLSGVSVPPNGTLRARGFVAGGENNSLVVAYSGVPLFLTQPASRTNHAGSTATFSAVVGANPPLFYQWRFYGTNLLGQTNSSLVLTGVTLAQAGPYVLVVTNASGVATSAVATLTVLDPFIVSQPANQYARPGESAQLQVVAGGTPPLGYQWHKNGGILSNGGSVSGVTSASLTLSNLVEADSGGYSVVVSNAYGSVTSVVATLTVADPFAQLGEAVDAPQLSWSSGGAAMWISQTAVTHDGLDAAQSGAISHSQETWLQTSVVGPGPLTFWWKVSSESGYDYLEFYTNSVRATRISGEVAWQQVNCTLGAGTHTLRWRYMKDSSDSSGQDRGWVDQVSFAPVIARPVITVNDSSFGIRTNRFGFNVSGPAGQVVVVEGSTNLLNWQSLQTNTLGSGPFYFSDPSTGTWPRRFYRVRVGP